MKGPELVLTLSLSAGLLAIANIGTRVAASAESATLIAAPKFNSDGSVQIPQDYRQWVHVGTRVKPIGVNILDGLQTKTPEIFNAYVEPSAMKAFNATGKWSAGSQLVKEFTAVKVGPGCDDKTSLCAGELGSGIFESGFIGLGMMVKDPMRFPNSPGNWGYFSFGHKPPPYNQRAMASPESQCAQCHIALASRTDYVITQAHVAFAMP